MKILSASGTLSQNTRQYLIGQFDSNLQILEPEEPIDSLIDIILDPIRTIVFEANQGDEDVLKSIVFIIHANIYKVKAESLIVVTSDPFTYAKNFIHEIAGEKMCALINQKIDIIFLCRLSGEKYSINQYLNNGVKFRIVRES